MVVRWFARALFAIIVMVMVAIVPVSMVAIAAFLAMVALAMVALVMVVLVMVAVALAMVAFVAIVPVFMVATTAMVAILLAPKDLRRIHSAAFEISTRAGLVQTYIEYHSSIRTGHGKNEASRHSYYDRSDFHDCTPNANGFRSVSSLIVALGSVKSQHDDSVIM